MPLRKQPKSLVDLAIGESAQVIFKLCVQIESKWGDYNEPMAKAQIQYLQNHLLETIPLALFNKLHERRSQSLEYELRDHRILLGVFLHKNLRSLSTLSVSLRALIASDDFWLEVLPTLKNIVELNLKLTCTDEILHVVGENCPKLESINCISKMSTVNRNFPSNLNFNALKVELFVSDEGLKSLTKCKKLKKVTMNRKINSQCAGKKPTIDGIRNLVKTLPELEYLTFDDLGSVISTGMEDCGPLSLLQLSDTHPTSDHIKEMARLCPNLKELLLIRPINMDNGNFENAGLNDSVYGSDVLTILSNTNLRLELLGLEHFSFDLNLVNYLTVKGHHLTSLKLFGHYEQITSEEILIIGEACPNLVGLHLLGLSPERKKFYPLKKPKYIFKNLSCINLGGGDWDPFTILPMCIIHAQNLVRMTLSNRGCEMVLDDLFTELMTIHKFQKLKVLNLYQGCVISFKTFQSFVFHCPSLSFAEVTASHNLTVAQVHSFVRDLIINNYDLIICVV